MATTSEAVQAILDGILANYGEVQLSEAEAKEVYGGSKASKVKDLAHSNLMQYALLHAHIQIQGLISHIENLNAPNRAQRRAAKKQGLVLPR
jgi:hypothetical protein